MNFFLNYVEVTGSGYEKKAYVFFGGLRSYFFVARMVVLLSTDTNTTERTGQHQYQHT